MRNLFGSIVPSAVVVLLAPSSYSPATWRSPKDLIGAFRQMYTDLERPGAIHRNVTSSSSMLRFSYVTPPVGNCSTWCDATIQTLTGADQLPEHLRPSANKKPVALYLPGLDGYGISAAGNQFDDLADNFQFWRLTVLPDDRSSFVQVVEAISDFVLSFDGQPVTLIGESCGGLFAAAVAIRLSAARCNSSRPHTAFLRGLVLVNPATSFAATQWEALVPVVASLESSSGRKNHKDDDDDGVLATPYGVIGSLLLSSIIPDIDQTRRIVGTILSLPDFKMNDPAEWAEMYQALVDGFRGTEERLPPALLEHRVTQWLAAGAAAVNARLDRIRVPVLVVAGAKDRVLPSAREAARLKRILPNNTETLIVKDRGHFVLDDNVNLTEAILYSKIDPYNWKQTKRAYDPITDWELPSDVYQYIEEQVQPLRTAFSPVYFSTDAVTGKRWVGLGKLPRPGNRPLLFVGNHQFAAIDLNIFMSELIENGIVARGLAHPLTFMGPNNLNPELAGRTPGLPLPSGPLVNAFASGGGFEKYGAVKVTPRNYYRVLQSGQNALLFPGGAAEALSGNKSYPLFWPEKVDFVRTAARFNATIVPLSAIGMLDSVNFIAEPQEIYKLPFIGERARLQNANVKAARYDQKNEDETVGFPLAFPTMPARNYFLFGKPIDTSSIDPSDKDACERVYKEAQQEVRRGIDDLLLAREHDPFKNFPQRFAYEQVFGKKAPTFPVSKLN